MSKTTKTVLAFIMACCAIPAGAGAIHTWAQGATLTSADLNANFQHIHNLMVGGHGARLVDADVSGSANIAQSKIAGLTAALAPVPKASALVQTCSVNGACTILANRNVTSVTRTGTGVYNIALGYTPTDTFFMPFAHNIGQSGGSHDWQCRAEGAPVLDGGAGQVFTTVAPQFTVRCTNGTGTNTLTDAEFDLLVEDDN